MPWPSSRRPHPAHPSHAAAAAAARVFGGHQLWGLKTMRTQNAHRHAGPRVALSCLAPLTCGTGSRFTTAYRGISLDRSPVPFHNPLEHPALMGRRNAGLLLGLLLLQFDWCLALGGGGAAEGGGVFPVVVSTWPFREAVRAAWEVVAAGSTVGSAVDAVVAGCSACEVLRCDGTVGPGGSPDENGETTLDALIMNGTTMEIGAVAAMRYVKDGIKAAKLVMEHTGHTLLVGEKATAFAISMGLAGPTNLSSPESIEKWSNWRQNHCQPNFWKNVVPAGNCGPYYPINLNPVHRTVGEIQRWLQSDNLLEPTDSHLKSVINRHNHDTISMAVIDKMGHVAVGTSTNGATFKIPGRVGDGPIPGSSAYGDDEVGACGATGDGDIMMRFLPCYQVVESMRRGMEPRDAAIDAISRISRKYPDFVGALFAVNNKGVHAGACHGWTFQYSVRNSSMEDVEVITVTP